MGINSRQFDDGKNRFKGFFFHWGIYLFNVSEFVNGGAREHLFPTHDKPARILPSALKG